MKKITSIIICLIITLAVCLTSTGCSQFKIDKVKYYNEVVATVGESKITRHELLSAYNSYGKSDYLTDDTTELEAIKKTLEHMEHQEALYLYGKDTYQLTENEKYNNLLKVFNTADNYLNSFKDEAYSILGITLNTDTDTDSSSTADDPDQYTKVSTTAYTIEDYKYKKRATLVTKENGDVVIKYVVKDVEKLDGEDSDDEGHKLHTLLAYLNEDTTPEKDLILEIKDSYFKYYKSTLEEELKEKTDNYSEELLNQAYDKIRSLFASYLIDYEYYLRDENGNAYSKVTEELFNRYFARMYETGLKQAYAERVELEYYKTVEFDPQTLVDKYNELVKADYEAYSNDEDAYISKLKDIASSGDPLFYHKELDGQQAGYFLHTLLHFQGETDSSNSFTEAHGGEGYRANQLKDNVTDQDTYNTEMAELINNMKINYRGEDGLFARDEDGHLLSVGIADVLEEYNAIVAMPNTTEAEKTARLNKFIEFMFKYSKDDATLTASAPYYTTTTVDNETVDQIIIHTPYIVGGNSDDVYDENDLSNKVSWDTAFAEEGLKILNSDLTMSEAITTTDDKITANDIPKLCITKYGIHFLYYVGDVTKNDIAYTGEDITGYNFLSNTLNDATEETYFDRLFNIVYPAEAGSTEVYNKENGYEDWETAKYEELFNNDTYKLNVREDILNGTKTNID